VTRDDDDDNNHPKTELNQHLSCTSPSCKLWNSQLVKKINCEDTLNEEKASNYLTNPPPKDSTSKDEMVDVD
jgi:hypothetical protein